MYANLHENDKNTIQFNFYHEGLKGDIKLDSILLIQYFSEIF